jgi:hypothetical protein
MNRVRFDLCTARSFVRRREGEAPAEPPRWQPLRESAQQVLRPPASSDPFVIKRLAAALVLKQANVGQVCNLSRTALCRQTDFK